VYININTKNKDLYESFYDEFNDLMFSEVCLPDALNKLAKVNGIFGTMCLHCRIDRVLNAKIGEDKLSVNEMKLINLNKKEFKKIVENWNIVEKMLE